MFSHVMIGANDIDAAKTFYDATFTAFGGNAGVLDPHGRLVYQHNGAMFLVTSPINGEPACGANGGTAIEDSPGPREGTPYYLAYLKDPSGNKLCALHYVG